MIVQGLACRDAKRGGEMLRAVRLRQKRGRERVHLNGRQSVLRHFQRTSKRPGIAYLRRDVVRQGMRDSWREEDLRQRTAADGGEFRSKVIRLLHSINFVTGGAATLDHQCLAVFDLGPGGGS